MQLEDTVIHVLSKFTDEDVAVFEPVAKEHADALRNVSAAGVLRLIVTERCANAYIVLNALAPLMLLLLLLDLAPRRFRSWSHGRALPPRPSTPLRWKRRRWVPLHHHR